MKSRTLHLKKQDVLRRSGFWGFMAASLVLFAMLALAACVPLKNEEVNKELFKDQAEMKTKVAQLKPGMTKDQVFKALNIPMPYFEQMSTEQVQLAVYGRSEVQGSPEQLEKFKRTIMGYEGYSLPYRSIDSSGSLGLGKINVKKKGYDLRLNLVFEDNKLIRSNVEGRQRVNEQENQPMWGSIIKAGVGRAF